MAENRQLVEKDNADLVACLAQAGWEAATAPDQSVRPVTDLKGDQLDMYHAAHSECSRSLFGGKPDRTEAEWRVKYAHALDTRACLVAHGYTISEPPSEDTWVQEALSGSGGLWAPFWDVVQQIDNGTITMDEQTWYDLVAACPQDGPTVGYRAW